MAISLIKGTWVIEDPNGMIIAKFVSLYNLCRWIETTGAGGRICL